MSHAQSGILVAHSKFGLFIEAMVVGEIDQLRQGCQQFIQSLSELQKQYPDASLGAVVALVQIFGKNYQIIIVRQS